MKKHTGRLFDDGAYGERREYYLASEVDALIAQENATQLRLCEEAQIAAATIARQGQRIADLERALRALVSIPAVLHALGRNHVAGCKCPLCVAQSLVL